MHVPDCSQCPDTVHLGSEPGRLGVVTVTEVARFRNQIHLRLWDEEPYGAIEA